MTLACPAHGTVHLASPGQPRSRFFEVAHRIAERFEPEIAEAFLEAIENLRENVDMDALISAIRANDLSAVEAALGTEALAKKLDETTALRDAFARLFTATAEASSEVLSAHGMALEFRALNPLAIQFARSQTATLVTRVSADQRIAIRGIMGRAFEEGIPPRESARLIHRIVGLRHDHATAPLSLAEEIRSGQAAAATSRRLDAITKARIRSRIDAGTVTETFIDEVVETYTHALRRYRAESISRTETIRSSSGATEESWRIGQRQGVISQEAVKVVIVTPDDRLRATHAAVPGMNPDGVPVAAPFNTPWGPLFYPPWEVNCRCGIGLIPNPGQAGIL